MKVEIFTVVKNGGEHNSLFYEHYHKAFPECIFNIYDNYSTDDTREYFLEKNCTVKSFCKYTEDNLQKFKNTVWKNSKADWVLVCDIDEIVEITSEDLKKERSDVIKFKSYQMIKMNLDSNLNQLTYGYRFHFGGDYLYDKTLMFRSTISDINFDPGSHTSRPTTNNINEGNYKMFHFKLSLITIQSSLALHFSPHEIKLVRTDRKSELEKIKRMNIDDNGIWTNRDVEEGHFFDHSLAKGLCEFFKNEKATKVGDFGCGLGDYVGYLNKNGIPSDGYDGNPFTTEINPFCKVLDLSKPQFIQKYSWVISFEVGEHIPQEYEDVFINNLHNNTTKGVIITWALEGVPGYGHINCRDWKYIKDKFIELNYTLDEDNTNKLRDLCELQWLSWSLMVLRKN